MGMPIKIGKDEYHLNDGVFGVRRTRHTIGRPELDEEVLLRVDVTIPGFIHMCEKLSPQELLEIAANIGLNRVKSNRRRI